DFEAFSLRLDHVAECVNLSEVARALLWDRTIYYTFKALVQGYCEGGKCSTEGRALMQLDFQHLLLKEYTAKQMISLLGVATHVSKKARTRIINALND
ncbi:hypothetical protein ANCDUO_19609, partial [Ancylostoma duodenale]